MRPEDEPSLAPDADSPARKRKRAAIGKGLMLLLVAFAAFMFTLYAAIILWTGVSTT